MFKKMLLLDYIFLRYGEGPQNEEVLGYSGELSEGIRIYLIFM